MKKVFCILAILLLSSLFLGACSGILKSTSEKRHDALIDCQIKADKKYQARYTEDWNECINECMQDKGFEGPY